MNEQQLRGDEFYRSLERVLEFRQCDSDVKLPHLHKPNIRKQERSLFHDEAPARGGISEHDNFLNGLLENLDSKEGLYHDTSF